MTSARREIALAREIKSPKRDISKEISNLNSNSENVLPIISNISNDDKSKKSGKRKKTGLTGSLSKMTSSPLRTSRSFAKTLSKTVAHAGKKVKAVGALAMSTSHDVGDGGSGKKQKRRKTHRPTLSSSANDAVYSSKLAEDFGGFEKDHGVADCHTGGDEGGTGGDDLEREVLEIMARKKRDEIVSVQHTGGTKGGGAAVEVVAAWEGVDAIVAECTVDYTEIMGGAEGENGDDDDGNGPGAVDGNGGGKEIGRITEGDNEDEEGEEEEAASCPFTSSEISTTIVSSSSSKDIVESSAPPASPEETPLNVSSHVGKSFPVPKRSPPPLPSSTSKPSPPVRLLPTRFPKTAPSPYTADAASLIKGKAKVSVIDKVREFQESQKAFANTKERKGKVVESPWTKDAQSLISKHAKMRVVKEKGVVEGKVRVEECKREEERARSPRRVRGVGENKKLEECYPDNKQDESPGEESCVTSLGSAISDIGVGAIERLRGLGSLLVKSKNDGGADIGVTNEGGVICDVQKAEGKGIRDVEEEEVIKDDQRIGDVKPDPTAPPSEATVEANVDDFGALESKPSSTSGPASVVLGPVSSDIDVSFLLSSASPSGIPKVPSTSSLASVRSSGGAKRSRRAASPLRSTGRSSHRQTPIQSHKRTESGNEINHPFQAKKRRSGV